MGHSWTWWAFGAVLGGVLATKIAIAASLGVSADEAYHWVWSLRPAAGYYDQPPLVAWVIASTTAVAGSTPLALRVGPVLCAVAGVAALASRGRDPVLALLWMVGLPPLFWTTQLAVPDGLLIGGWALALRGALAGGRGFLVMGLGAGLAGLAKPTAWGLVPLLAIALDAGERRSGWFWAGVGVNLGLLLPFFAWLVAHDGVTLAFQAGENLSGPLDPGGPLRQVVEQAAFATPLAFLALITTADPLRGSASSPARAEPPDREARIAWWASVPVLVAFAVAALFGTPEAHWPAPAYLGAGLGIAASAGWRRRLAWLGAITGLLGSLLLAVHASVPLVPLEVDPAARFGEGPLLADALAEAAVDGPVYTERYQEAAMIRYHTGLVAVVLPGCGRRSQYDLWHELDGFEARAGHFVRPARSGPPGCIDAHFPTKARVQGPGDRGGPWDIWRVEP